jgi:isocitrate lyase
METSNPDLEQARSFAEGIHAKFPGKMLAYNCSPSFNWAAKLSVEEMQISVKNWQNGL